MTDYWTGRRAHEERINSFPNYTQTIKDDDGNEYTMHFIALFSENSNAIPIAFYHGWPGSFLEFLSMLDLIKKQYSAKDLPYHIIVPSMPGYAFSSGPPVDKDFELADAVRLCNNLMQSLGFADGYIAQGGDLGSFISKSSARTHDSCKGLRYPAALSSMHLANTT